MASIILPSGSLPALADVHSAQTVDEFLKDNFFFQSVRSRSGFGVVEVEDNLPCDRRHVMTQSATTGRIETTKFRNVTFGWRNLFLALSGGGLSLVAGLDGSTSNRAFAIMGAALSIAAMVKPALTKELSENHTAAILGMWTQSRGRALTFEEGLVATNKTLLERGLPPMSAATFAETIDQLHALHCVRKIDGFIHLVEMFEHKAVDKSPSR